jgi:hypothetical protein
MGAGRAGTYGHHVPLDGASNAVAEFDVANTQTYRGSIGLGPENGPYISLGGGARWATLRDTQTGTRDFNFRGQQFFGRDTIKTKFEFLIADADLEVHPWSSKWGRVDITLGGRYIYSYVNFRDTTSPTSFSQQTLESVIPMLGLGGVLRPVHAKSLAIELYARGRVGGFAWETQGTTARGHTVDESFYSCSLQAEGGMSILIGGTIGVTAGWLFEAVEIEKEDKLETKRASWTGHGPFAGLVVEF